MLLRTLSPVLALVIAFANSVRAEEGQAVKALYPEGPLWQGERLYYAEMRADRITVIGGQDESVFFEQEGCGPTAIAPYREGYLILCHLGRRVVAVDTDGRERRRWESDDAGVRLADPNDASADGRGGVYFSDPGPFAHTALPQGRVMHLSADGALKAVAGPLWYPNGVHVKGRTLYVSEHLRGRILRYHIGSDGLLGEMEVFADLSDAIRHTLYPSEYALSGPDGLEFGPDGALYVALYGKGELLRLSEAGEYLESIATETRFLTNIAFGASGVALTGSFDNQSRPQEGQVKILKRLP